MTSPVADRLRTLRGPVAPRRHNARTIAALTANPGCDRRAVLDAAGVDKVLLAEQVGHPARFGQSPFAISRGVTFESGLKADGHRALLAAVRERLGLAEGPAAVLDLGRSEAAQLSNEERHERTRQALSRADVAVIDHPMLRVEVAGQPVYLEPDLVAARLDGQLRVVEIKSFPIIDGRADQAKVAAAAMQAAVYVLALRQLHRQLGRPAADVSADVLLVCPRDFGNQPAVAVLDTRRQVAVLSRQLARMTRIADLLDRLPEGLSFDLALDADGVSTRPAGELAGALAATSARYVPECRASCELALHCRTEARGSTGALGASVREALGGAADVATALALAEGRVKPGPHEQESARLLRHAARLRAEALA
ncbi:hypothetical protein [Pilimelia columellifera]|uniref:hypothetical protein n=1 Tax=Pilimelia columellifera TaxID=706574 RepID=UPI0031D16F3E